MSMGSERLLEADGPNAVPFAAHDDQGVVVHDASGTITGCTPEAQRILGLTMDQLLGRTARDPRWAAIDELGVPLANEQYPAAVVLATGSAVVDFVMGVHRPTSDRAGEYVWLSVNSRPQPITGLLSTDAVVTSFTPIEGERRAALQLAQSERMYRLLALRATEIVSVHTLDATILWASPAALTVIGHEPQDLVGMSAFDLMHPADVHIARTALEGILGGGAPATFVVRLGHRLGRWIWTEVSAQVVTDGDGAPYQLQCSTRDVTDRIEAEQARDAAVAVFEAVMDISPIGMVLRELDGRVRRSNLAVQRMVGRSSNDLLGTTMAHVLTPASDEPAVAPNGVQDEADASMRVESSCLRPDGSTVWVESSTITLYDHKGYPVALFEQFQDITARKQTHWELERLAGTDPLTSLLNRTAFATAVESALSDARLGHHEVGVIFVDIDRFKDVNDTFGHHAGDVALQEIARRFRAAVGYGDSVARLGGDEFVVVCPRVHSRQDLELTARQIEDSLLRPFIIADSAVTIEVSLGVALGADGTPESLLREADRAMYLAKYSGRSSH